MKYKVKLFHLNIPDKALLKDLRNAAAKSGKNHITASEYKKEGSFSHTTICRRFGGWNKALIKAGLKAKHVRNVSDYELLENMKNVWDSLGRQPRWEEMSKPLSEFYGSAYPRHFGSWQKALLEFEKAMRTGKFKSLKKRAGFTKAKSRHVNKMHISKSIRYDVFNRDKFKCRLCGASPAADPRVILHVDHIKPKSKGGGSDISNLQTLCSDCNYGKGTKSMSNVQLSI
jgi:hypothetical protein